MGRSNVSKRRRCQVQPFESFNHMAVELLRLLTGSRPRIGRPNAASDLTRIHIINFPFAGMLLVNFAIILLQLVLLLQALKNDMLI